MQHPKLAKDIMVTKLVTLSPHMDVFDAVNLLLKHQVSGAPVIDEERNFVGVFSEKCCMSLLVEGAYEQLPTSELSAFIDPAPPTITEETDILTIAQTFLTTGTRRLPVLKDGKLIGQISRRDVLQAAMNLMHVAPDREKALLYLSSLIERDDAPIG